VTWGTGESTLAHDLPGQWRPASGLWTDVAGSLGRVSGLGE
jgi:hypothetical protein